MSYEILTPDEMAAVDRMAIARGPLPGISLMRNAGAAVARLVLERYGHVTHFHVLCGPGNNGGDGYVVAKLLRDAGATVSVWAAGKPSNAASDAALAAADYSGKVGDLSAFAPQAGSLVVDALYGAGLCRPVKGDDAQAIARCAEAAIPVVAVDLPSGVLGASGKVPAAAFRAELTVTFMRRKPGHLLLPGRQLCGEVVVANIGIADAVVAEVGPACFENVPDLWMGCFPSPAMDTHKYRRGHVGVFSGQTTATGAARLAAMAAARAGAGAVTVLSPASALDVNASHLTSIMLCRAETMAEICDFLKDRHVAALVYGPGLADGRQTGARLIEMVEEMQQSLPAMVIDASALTSLALQAEAFFAVSGGEYAPTLILTPHEGEFGRLFPDIADNETLSKLERARSASKRSASIVVLKGPDTIIAAPDGKAAINVNATPWLATAGSGDVLSGIITALLAQNMPPFEAACAGVWLHGEAGRRFGPGLIADDLPPALPSVLNTLGVGR